MCHVYTRHLNFPNASTTCKMAAAEAQQMHPQSDLQQQKGKHGLCCGFYLRKNGGILDPFKDLSWQYLYTM